MNSSPHAKQTPRLSALFAAGFALFAGLPSPAQAQDRFYLYNLTTRTVFTGVYAAKAGSAAWGGNQTGNDRDHAVDPSERLRIDGIGHEKIDVRLVWRDAKGAETACVKHGVDLTRDTSFDIRDDDLAACR
jgi:hypothetical protein